MMQTKGAMKMNDLKPCPFCGSEAEYLHWGTLAVMQYRPVFVRCKKCGARTEDVEASTEYCANDRAAELWNRRVSDD